MAAKKKATKKRSNGLLGKALKAGRKVTRKKAAKKNPGVRGASNVGVIRKTKSTGTGPNIGRIVAKRPMAKKNPTRRTLKPGQSIALGKYSRAKLTRKNGKTFLEVS